MWFSLRPVPSPQAPDSTPLREFERQPDIRVRFDEFTVTLPPNSLLTITSRVGLGAKGSHPTPPAAKPFPVPYAEDFDGCVT